MTDITKIDPNMKVEAQVTEPDIVFYDVNSAPFQLHGVFYENGKFRRMSEEVAKNVSEGVYALHANTAGGRVRFKTNSKCVAIKAKLSGIKKLSFFSLTGSSGFDLFSFDGSEKYVSTFVPPFDMVDGYESSYFYPTSEMREFTINFPLYTEVTELYVGVYDDAEILPPRQYKIEKPVVFYGSSITQGGFASRPGNAYESILSRRFDFDFINLGFAGRCKGEPEMAEYISKLDMSVFVCDYDYNAPTPEHLEETHANLYKTVRATHPELPVVFMTRPKINLSEKERERLEIIKATYEKAKANGDNNVYFIDGKKLMALAGTDGTVDNVHPNDLGFASIAKAVGDVLETIL